MIEVSAAIIVSGSKIFCVQKGKSKYPYLSGKFEFPGGKVEPGETPEETLIREIAEELKADISEAKISRLCDTEYDYPDFSVRLHSFTVEPDGFDFTLTEHTDSKWVSPDELDLIDWADADREIVQNLKGWL